MAEGKTAVLKIYRIPGKKSKIPQQATKYASGFDLESLETYTVPAGHRQLVKTGLIFEVPEGYEVQIRPRSGMAIKYGMTVLNTPGTIDSDYRGEVGVILVNHGKHCYTVKPGERIAQAVVVPVPEVIVEEVFKLTETERGSGGFGSTGK